MDCLIDDILIQIFLRLKDPKSLANCTGTCRCWANILSADSSFWVTKCKFDTRSLPTVLLSRSGRVHSEKMDYRQIWLKNPYGRNLIKNDSGQDGFTYWDIQPRRWAENQTIQGGVLMVPIEKPPRMADADMVECCFATSYFECTKTQVVDLIGEGVEEWILDEIKPAVVVSEWHGSSQDCGSLYRLRVALLDSDREEIGTPFTTECTVQQWTGGNWEQALHRFIDYPAGVRFIHFSSMGVDTQFWAGFFGAKMAKASVRLEFS